MGNGSAAPGSDAVSEKVAGALADVVSLLVSSEPLSGRAIKAALPAGHARAAVEAALTHGVDSSRLVAVDGPRNARLYRLNKPSVPSVPVSRPSVPVSQAAAVSGNTRAIEAPETPAAGTPADLCTRRDLARRMSVVMQTVTKWEQDGMPVAEPGRKGKPSLYRLVDVQAWLGAREDAAKNNGTFGVAQERARKERAQAQLAEQTFQMRSRDLLPRQEIERVWAAEVAAVRTKLMAWSTTIADRVHRAGTLDGIVGVEHELREAVENVLRELADPERIVEPPPAPDDDEEDEAGQQQAMAI